MRAPPIPDGLATAADPPPGQSLQESYALMTIDAMTRMLQEHFEGDAIDVHDMTGTMDHFEIEIVSPRFEGKSLIEQHKMVHAALAEHMGGAIHAVKIKTRTP